MNKEKVFAMSMYLNKSELYKAKAEYYEKLYRKTNKKLMKQIKQNDKNNGTVDHLHRF